jgi:tetratricopeptide (TPR) repeat protein
MRFILLLLCAVPVIGRAQDATQVLTNTQALQDAGHLREAAQELTELLAKPESKALSRTLIATIWGNLATVYHDMGETKKAERAYGKARELLANSSGDRTMWFRTTASLAALYLETSQTGKAERLIESMRGIEPPEGEDAARFNGTVASLHMVRGRRAEAQQLYESVLAYWRQTRSVKEMAIVLNNLAVLALEQGDPATGAARLAEALELLRQGIGDSHPAVLKATANYGNALLASKQDQKAVEVLEQALTISRQANHTVVTAHLAALYSQALRATGRKEEAKRMKDEADRMQSALSASHPGRHTVDVLDLVPKR